MQAVVNAGAGAVEEHYYVGEVVAAAGRTRVEASLGPWARMRDGRFAGGVLGPLIDMAWSHAVLERRPRGRWGVSTEISVDFVADPEPNSRLIATGEALTVDSDGGAAHGEVRDDAGEVVAVGTLWSAFIDVAPPEDSERVGDIDPARAGGSAAGRPADFEGLVGLSDEASGLILPKSPQMTNPLGVGHGGALFAAAALAATNALDNDAGRLESLRGVYIRQAVGDITLATSVVHAGRRLATVLVTAHGADGRPAAHFTAVVRTIEQA